MDYEKLHKDTINKLQQMVNSGKITVKTACGICADFVPESEDEVIRKWLIGYFNQYIIDGMPQVFGNGLNVKDVLAWLEKQGQKPVDKVEHKFKNGQWIVWQNKYYKVNDNGCGYELIGQNGLSTSLEYGTIDENAHLWDVVEDAKDGDVLVTSNYIYIFNSIDKETETVGFYCLMKKSDEHFSFGDYKIHDEILNSIPATKEQRDLLFQKMKVAGYEWDAEKKEVRKIEQKSSWSEEDEQIALSIEQVMNCASLLNIVPEKIDKIRTWLKSLKDRVQPPTNV